MSIICTKHTDKRKQSELMKYIDSYSMIFDKSKAIKYHVKSLNNMNKFCPDARPGYREKALDSMKYLRKKMDPESWQKYRKKIKKFRNKCLMKVKGKI